MIEGVLRQALTLDGKASCEARVALRTQIPGEDFEIVLESVGSIDQREQPGARLLPRRGVGDLERAEPAAA